MPKVTQQIRGRLRIYPQVCLSLQVETFPLLSTIEPRGLLDFHGRGSLPGGLDPGLEWNREVMITGAT